MDSIDERRLKAADNCFGVVTPSLFGDSDCECHDDWTCLGCIRTWTGSFSQARRLAVQQEAERGR